MPSYYETLGVTPAASVSEIVIACDTLYNRWRPLVNHQEAGVAAQASQALRAIEEMRATLSDAEKRGVYDAGLGIGGAGGLADPEALVRQAPMTHPWSHAATSAPSEHTPTRTDAWICPGCQNANAVGLQFCAKCGAAIGRGCPQCGRTIFVQDPFCPHCGTDVGEAQRARAKQQLTELQGQLQRVRDELAPYQRLSQESVHLGAIPAGVSVPSGGSLVILLLVVAVVLTVGAIGQFTPAALIVGAVISLVGAYALGGWFAAQTVKPWAASKLEECSARARSLEREIEQVKVETV